MRAVRQIRYPISIKKDAVKLKKLFEELVGISTPIKEAS